MWFIFGASSLRGMVSALQTVCTKEFPHFVVFTPQKKGLTRDNFPDLY